ncbi:MAG TPA: class I SAM-dependent methyltransferase [Acidimicrobiia bacterium]|nr:class I SAM-dependent methyltransferase [Acidimicrobiia bacterium]
MTNHFDERAATWDDDPAKVQRAQEIASAMRARVPLDASTRLLEYGAGTGLVSQALRDAVGAITMVDTSAGMRSVMERKVADGVIADARVWNVDLATEPAPDEQFDLIVTAMTLHHIPHVEPVLANFARLLVTGGHLCIADLEEEDGTFHPDGFDGHHGFNRDTLRTHLLDAGFRDIEYESNGHIVRDGIEYPIFLATCTRG